MSAKKQKETIYVHSAQQPLFCPQDTHWNAHPRVFLSLSAAGDATCPYCGCYYALKKKKEAGGYDKK